MPLHEPPDFHPGLGYLSELVLRFSKWLPQSNCLLKTVPSADPGGMVRSETTKERCFIGVLRLPPTLNSRSFISISSNSKAPRGLFVLEHLGRIFTAISISPREGSRQLSSRGSFRAGLNSPDEGLRYHRTVIVTAAVHPGLDSKLTWLTRSPQILTYGHWAGFSSYTYPYGLAETCVLVKQPLDNLLL